MIVGTDIRNKEELLNCKSLNIICIFHHICDLFFCLFWHFYPVQKHLNSNYSIFFLAVY